MGAIEDGFAQQRMVLSTSDMEQFKTLQELTEMDHKHLLLGKVCGSLPCLESMHQGLSEEILNDEVPDTLKGQFNVAKNMALYSYFFYALAPEVHLKSYRVMELALQLRIPSNRRMTLKEQLDLAIKQGWVSDAGFRHIAFPCPNNSNSKRLLNAVRQLRNAQAHGSPMLVGDCVDQIAVCADFVNQLFPVTKQKSKLKS